MNVTKAVVTAAGPGQNLLPLQGIVDENGDSRTALELILEESVGAGVQDICVVIRPGDGPAYRSAAGEHANDLTFVEQRTPRGYGDALFCAADFVGDQPFLHLVGDHLYLSRGEQRCARQLVTMAEADSCAVSGVQATRENQLRMFGAVGARRLPKRSNVYEITKVIEKPTPTRAEQELVVAGLRASHYLCMFGLHVLTPMVMELLARDVRDRGDDIVHLSPALDRLANCEKYLAQEVRGDRYNIGVKYGLLMAQLAISMSGKDRDDIMTQLLETVVTKRRAG